jgi:hypothetical protein
MVGAAGGLRNANAFEAGEEDEVLHDLHLLVEAALLGKVSDTVEEMAGERLAKDTDCAGVRNGDSHHHADGAGFSGTIGTEETEDFALGNTEGEMIDGNKIVKSLGGTIQFQGESHEPPVARRNYSDERIVLKRREIFNAHTGIRENGRRSSASVEAGQFTKPFIDLGGGGLVTSGFPCSSPVQRRNPRAIYPS